MGPVGSVGRRTSSLSTSLNHPLSLIFGWNTQNSVIRIDIFKARRQLYIPV